MCVSITTLCFCVSAAPLRYNTMTIIWICMALVSALVTFLAIIICRKRQGYTLPHYPSLLCVQRFFMLIYRASLCGTLCVSKLFLLPVVTDTWSMCLEKAFMPLEPLHLLLQTSKYFTGLLCDRATQRNSYFTIRRKITRF